MLEQPRFNLTEMNPDIYRHLMQMEALIARNVESDALPPHQVARFADQWLRFLPADAHRPGPSARRDGPERMMALDAWEESPLYTDKERAALRWTEELTLIADKGASRDAFES